MRRLLAALALALAISSTAAAETLNLTAENRDFLKTKVEQLQQIELWTVSRGRWKPNPVNLPAFTVYQTMLTSSEHILSNHNSRFSSSLMRLRKISEGRHPGAAGVDSSALLLAFESELVRLYRLKDIAGGSASIMELSLIIEQTQYAMEALPTQAEMALSAMFWLNKHYNGRIPDSAAARFKQITETRPTVTDTFELNSALDAVSAEYSRLMLSAVRGEFK